LKNRLVGGALALKLESVLTDPACTAGTSLGLVVAGAVSQTSGLSTSGGLTSALTPLMNCITNPVNGRVISDSGVLRINQDYFVILVSGVLGNPIAV